MAWNLDSVCLFQFVWLSPWYLAQQQRNRPPHTAFSKNVPPPNAQLANMTGAAHCPAESWQHPETAGVGVIGGVRLGVRLGGMVVVPVGVGDNVAVGTGDPPTHETELQVAPGTKIPANASHTTRVTGASHCGAGISRWQQPRPLNVAVAVIVAVAVFVLVAV